MAQSQSPSRQLWSIALPAMLTNVATALFGLADMWAIGRLGDAPAQGAVELGAKYMFGLLNVFNFLRTSTIALTAQSAGRRDADLQGATLARAMAVAVGIGALLLILRPWATSLGLDLLQADGQLRTDSATYIGIRYWAGPIWLANCVLVGWLIGRRRLRFVLGVEIFANIVHIALDLVLVLIVKWGVAGVAIATVSSELLKFILLACVVVRAGVARQAIASIWCKSTWRRRDLAQLFALNRDLFLRTLLLTAAMLIFARSGAQAGPVTLAANGILFQLFMLATLLLDGFESAAQVLCGEARGEGSKEKFALFVRSAVLWGGITGLALSALYLLAGARLAAEFSLDPEVVQATAKYALWLSLLPAIGAASFVLDGVFVGAGWTRAMLGAMAAAMLLYLGLLIGLRPLGNTGLWIAFIGFLLARAIGQAVILPTLTRRTFAN